MTVTSRTGTESFADQIRSAVARSGLSRYSISKATGITQAQLSRFVAGKQWLTEGSLNRLTEHLGIRVEAMKARRRGGHDR